MKNIVDQNSVLTNHLKMIRSIAWNLHLRTGHDPEDLFSEGCLQYLLLRGKYDKYRGTTLTTFLWKTVTNKLIDYIRIYSRRIKALPGEHLFLDESLVEFNDKKYPVKDVFEYNSF